MPSKRALIVDDSRSARAFLARLLERQGLEVDGVGSASEAYAYLRRQLPDVLFLDHLMPEADGFDVLKVLKKDARTRAIPVLMYTSQQGDDYLAQARALGAVGVLPKQLRALDVTSALDQLGLRSEPGATHQGLPPHATTQLGATQATSQATTVVDPHAPRAPTQATTVIDVNAPRPGAAAERAARTAALVAAGASAAAAAAAGAGSRPAPSQAGGAGMGAAPGGTGAVSPELRSLLEALVREQGLALRQQVSQLVTQQGERMANELRAIRREVGDMNERLAAGANAIAITGTHRARPPGMAPGRRALLWAGLVLAVIAAAGGATWLLRPDLWSGAAGDVAHAPAPASPAAGRLPRAAGAPVGATAPTAGAAPLFAAPESAPRDAAPRDAAPREAAPPPGTLPAEAAGAAEPASPSAPGTP